MRHRRFRTPLRSIRDDTRCPGSSRRTRFHRTRTRRRGSVVRRRRSGRCRIRTHHHGSCRPAADCTRCTQRPGRRSCRTRSASRCRRCSIPTCTTSHRTRIGFPRSADRADTQAPHHTRTSRSTRTSRRSWDHTRRRCRPPFHTSRSRADDSPSHRSIRCCTTSCRRCRARDRSEGRHHTRGSRHTRSAHRGRSDRPSSRRTPRSCCRGCRTRSSSGESTSSPCSSPWRRSFRCIRSRRHRYRTRRPRTAST